MREVSTWVTTTLFTRVKAGITTDILISHDSIKSQYSVYNFKLNAAFLLQGVVS